MTTRWRALAAAAWLGVVGACSAIVDGELGEVHCRDEGVVGAPACPDGMVCAAGLCAMVVAPPGLGDACIEDEDCGAGLCRATPAGKRCTTTCCTSSDCGDVALGFVCAATNEGTRLCQPASGGTLGDGRAGAVCYEDAGCRSGSCVDGRCVDTCCSDTSCLGGPSPTICRAATHAWTCSAPPEAAVGHYLDPCTSDEDCASGLCTLIGSAALCSRPCCGSETCGATAEGPIGCAEVPHGPSFVSACSVLLPVEARGMVGAACASDAECRSGLCDAASGSCTDRCCVDTDCGDASRACRPAPGALGLRCGAN